MNENSYSLHKFLFPFRWSLNDNKDTEKYTSLPDRTPLSRLGELNIIDSTYWKPFNYEIKVDDNHNTYNDYFYFYEAVRDVLNLELVDDNYINEYQFQYSGLSEESTICFKLKNKGEFILNIDEVYLNIYENGVGVFIFNLSNNKHHDFDDVLLINDYGRRICPQFLGGEGDFISAPKWSFLPDTITIKNVDTYLDTETIVEDFSHYTDLTVLNKEPFKIPRTIKAFLGIKICSEYDWLEDSISIHPIMDDRMYVMSYVLDTELLENCIYSQTDRRPRVEKLQDVRTMKHTEYNYIKNPDWYKYVFLDSNTLSCHSPKMMKEQLETSSYDRWLGYINRDSKSGKLSYGGQFYGVSRYSFCALAADDGFCRNIISQHFNSVYFSMVLIVLIQRSYVLNFSNEVAKITNLINRKSVPFRLLKGDISQLYLLYIKFVNRVNFREVTPQEQGIEIYDKMREVMRIGPEVSQLDLEMQELNTYVENYQQATLNNIANWFLPLALVAGFLGMNTLDYELASKDCPAEFYPTLYGVISILLVMISIFILIRQLLQWRK